MHFLKKKILISINFSLKFVPKGLVNNIATLVQIMAWRRPGDKPLSEPMMVILLTRICNICLFLIVREKHTEKLCRCV